jgi:hypothetical protein
MTVSIWIMTLRWQYRYGKWTLDDEVDMGDDSIDIGYLVTLLRSASGGVSALPESTALGRCSRGLGLNG